MVVVSNENTIYTIAYSTIFSKIKITQIAYCKRKKGLSIMSKIYSK